MANPAPREIRQIPIGMMDGVIVMDDEFSNRRPIITDDMVNPVMINTRHFGAIPLVTSDQQGEEQRYGGGWGGRPYGNWGGRPYGGGWGGRPYGGGGWGGRPYGGGGRPWY